MRALLLLLVATPLLAQSSAQPASAVDPSLLSALVWRNVGPFRGGRISAVSGAIGQPGVFYAGMPNGGVWKTTSAGETWYPIFDSIKSVSSVGAVAVAPSDPSVVYVGTGDMDSFLDGTGDGLYKSTDAGQTWRHIGLEETGQIPAILVDPRDANAVLVGALGDIRVSGAGRGVFRSTDGGTIWTKTLTIGDQHGVVALARAADAPDVVFAATVYSYFPPGAGRVPPPDTARARSHLYKSMDAGVTWREVSGNGLPALAGITSIAVGAGAQRVYLIGDFGLYRSDDGGASWRQVAADDKRIANGQGGYNCGVFVDPKNPDVVYTVNVTAYKSTDGGATFTGFKGGPPGGDDPQVMWIDPTNGKRMIMGYDQGAIVSFDGGDNWSSWYNQSNEQVYHIAADNSFPYWIYATQQDAGAIATRNRGDLGAVTTLDWKPVPGWEWGTIVPDPRNPNVVFSSGISIAKITYPAQEWINVGPDQDPSLKLRATLNLPIAFSSWRGKEELLAGYQSLLGSTDGGSNWTKLSPDLTVYPRDTTLPKRGLWSVSPSTVTPGVIWVGATNGIIQVTRDHGRTWADVTVPGTQIAFRPIRTMVEASGLAAGTAYAALDQHYRGDPAPYIYRTRDFGKTWTKIATGLPAFVHVVRADPKRRGLLFAGTERGVFVSFDDGDRWQSLMLNLPTTTINDIAIHDTDLILGTYGRGIWILDDYAVLRQLGGGVTTQLFKPSGAVRVRRNVMFNTPFPKEVPQGPNPPDGAIIYYSLGTKPSSEVTIEVLDGKGGVVRHLSSAPPHAVRELARPPMESFWLAPPSGLSTNIGLNRASWDLRYDPPHAFAHTFEFNGNPGVTPMAPEGPLVLPGTYTVRLTVDGKRYVQSLTVRPDPRSRISHTTLTTQDTLLRRLYAGLEATWADFKPVAELRGAVTKLAADTGSAAGKVAAGLAATLDSIGGDTSSDARQIYMPRPTSWGLADLNAEFSLQLQLQDNADEAPTAPVLAAMRADCDEFRKLIARWNKFLQVDLARLTGKVTRPLDATISPGYTCATRQ
jgi:photosystem II stability/assembly factor-like uncharacterized protein